MKRTLLILALLVLMLAGCAPDQSQCPKKFYPEVKDNGTRFSVLAEYDWAWDSRIFYCQSYAEADSVCRELNKRLEGDRGR